MPDPDQNEMNIQLAPVPVNWVITEADQPPVLADLDVDQHPDAEVGVAIQPGYVRWRVDVTQVPGGQQIMQIAFIHNLGLFAFLCMPEQARQLASLLREQSADLEEAGSDQVVQAVFSNPTGAFAFQCTVAQARALAAGLEEVAGKASGLIVPGVQDVLRIQSGRNGHGGPGGPHA